MSGLKQQIKQLKDNILSLRNTHKAELTKKDAYANKLENEKINLENRFENEKEVLEEQNVKAELRINEILKELKEVREKFNKELNKKAKVIYKLKVGKYVLKIYKKK